ncbi:hypothetical protein HRbin36_01948 [bacterium HR36]|nr:hypothetical protein HRbin36_01948 [bacterium HR36]
MRRHRKIAEYHQEHEQVIHGQSLFDDVTRQVFNRLLLAQFLRCLGMPPVVTEPDEPREQHCQNYPQQAP